MFVENVQKKQNEKGFINLLLCPNLKTINKVDKFILISD